MSSRKHYYRLSPVLWDSVPGQHTATVYGIDRMPLGPLSAFVTCCSRCKDDPAWFWAGAHFFRLVMPPGETGCCMGPQDIGNGVVWAQLPSWMSWAISNGYSFPDGFVFSKIGALDEITLIYVE